MENLLNTAAVCKLFNVRRSTVTKWIKKGMPYYQGSGIIRYKESEIRYWLENQKILNNIFDVNKKCISKIRILRRNVKCQN